MKVRALKKRTGPRLYRAIRRRAFDRSFQQLGNGLVEHLTEIQTQWQAALRQIAKSMVAALMDAGELRRVVGGATSSSFAERYVKEHR